jgi:hypothetical protein
MGHSTHRKGKGKVHSLGSHLSPLPDKGVTKKVSHKRTTTEAIPSTVSKEAAAIIRRIQAKNIRDNKG